MEGYISKSENPLGASYSAYKTALFVKLMFMYEGRNYLRLTFGGFLWELQQHKIFLAYL